MIEHFVQRVRNWTNRKFGFPPPLIQCQLLNHDLAVRYGTIRTRPDYDDAWLLACARNAETVFDIGANVDYSALLMLMSPTVKKMVLVEANPDALSIAAENLIRNHLASRVNFVSGFVGNIDGSTVKLWTIETGAAGSLYSSHARTAAKTGCYIEVSTVKIDTLCNYYDIIPDLLKIDVEGAEHSVLTGSTWCARQRKTRFLVEMHANPDVTMEENTANVMNWCDSMNYRAWYLAQEAPLTSPSQITHRGRCHLLLQPENWEYPGWLVGIKQSAALEAALN